MWTYLPVWSLVSAADPVWVWIRIQTGWNPRKVEKCWIFFGIRSITVTKGWLVWPILVYFSSAAPAAKAPASPTKSATHVISPVNSYDAPTHKLSSMADYKRKMVVKAASAGVALQINSAPSSGLSKVNHLSQSVYPRQRANNIPSGTVPSKKSGISASSERFRPLQHLLQ